MAKQLNAYHGDQKLKDQVLAELQADYDANNFAKDQEHDWENGKVWVIGHLLNFKNNIEYETRLGIPVTLSGLEDFIFKSLPKDKTKELPLRFMSSFEVGKDYSSVIWDFLRWLLLDYLFSKVTQEGKIYDDVRAALKRSASVLGSGDRSAADTVSCAALAAAEAAGSYASYATAVDVYTDASYAARAAYAARSVATASSSYADAASSDARAAAEAAVYAAAIADLDARASSDADAAAAAVAARDSADARCAADADARCAADARVASDAGAAVYAAARDDYFAYEQFADKIIKLIGAV